MKKILTVIVLIITGALPSIAQVINNPYVATSEDRSTTIKKIETNSKYTIVTFEKKAFQDSSWVNLNKEIYLQTDVDNTHYNCVKSENIAMTPVRQYLRNAGDKLVFNVYFNKIPAKAKKISIIERPGPTDGSVSYFNFYNVSLSQSGNNYASLSQPNSYQYGVNRVIVDSVRIDPPVSARVSTFGIPNAIGNAMDIKAIDIDKSGIHNEMATAMSAVMPMMSNIAKVMMDAQLEYYKQPGKLAEVAKLNKAYYDALKKEGFSSDEALKIITSESIMPKPTVLNNK